MTTSCEFTHGDLAAAKDKDRLFRESVLMALQKIDPAAAFGAAIK